MKDKTGDKSLDIKRAKVVKKRKSVTSQSLQSAKKKVKKSTKKNLGIKVPISLKKRTAKQSDTEEEKYLSILNNINDGCVETDLAGNFTFINDSGCRIFGYSRTELLGSNYRHYMDKKTAKKIFAAYNKVYRTGNPLKGFNWVTTRKEGTKRQIETSISLQKNSIGKPIGFTGIVNDITERKQAEKALRKKTQELDRYFTTSLDLLCIADTDGYFRRLNPEWEKMLGYPLTELIGRRFLDFVHPDDLEATLAAISELDRQEEVLNFENRYRCKDNSYRWIEWRAYPQGKLIYAVARDITKRKYAEEALYESEQKYKNLIENILDIIITIDLEGKITFVSKKMKEILGYENEETINRNILNFISEEAHQIAMQTLEKGMKGEKIRHIQLPVTAKSGEKLFFDFSFTRLYKDGAVIGAQGIAVDISERKRAEEALRESEARFREVLENSADASYKRNLKTDNYDYLSPVFTKNYGYTMDEMMTKPLEALMDLVHPDDLAEAKRMIAESSFGAAGTAYQIKYRIKHKNGPYRWCLDQFTIIRDTDGVPSAVIGSVKDITEQQKAEESLRESQQRYQELSTIDDLTQLYNSRHFYAQLEREMERSNRYGQPLTLLMLDIDKFKNYNDTYGHLEGNQVLSRLGQVIKRYLRDTDSAYRYGGEEFMIMLPMTASREGIVTAERIQSELRKEGFSPVLDQKVYMTVSIGLAQYKPKEELTSFVQRVDQLMYEAKRKGRNRICSES